MTEADGQARAARGQSYTAWSFDLQRPVLRWGVGLGFALLIVVHVMEGWFIPQRTHTAHWTLLLVAFGCAMTLLTTELRRLRPCMGWATLALGGAMLVRALATAPGYVDPAGELVLHQTVLTLAFLGLAPSTRYAIAGLGLTYVVPVLAAPWSGISATDPHLVVAQATLAVGGVGLAWLLGVLRRRAWHELQGLRLLGDHDDLTGLLNRQAFMAAAEARLATARLSNQLASLAYVDADRFKAVNDTYGHAVGDEVLQAFASRLHTAAGPDALAGRLGGEEFAVLWVDLPADEALARARGLQQDLRLTEPVPVTASVGLATEDTPRLEPLMRHADRGLHAAKDAGRDQVALGLATTPMPHAQQPA